MNWKEKLFQILECFETVEGTMYETEWADFGITPEEEVIIKCEYNEWRFNKNRKA